MHFFNMENSSRCRGSDSLNILSSKSDFTYQLQTYVDRYIQTNNNQLSCDSDELGVILKDRCGVIRHPDMTMLYGVDRFIVTATHHTDRVVFFIYEQEYVPSSSVIMAMHCVVKLASHNQNIILLYLSFLNQFSTCTTFCWPV